MLFNELDLELDNAEVFSREHRPIRSGCNKRYRTNKRSSLFVANAKKSPKCSKLKNANVYSSLQSNIGGMNAKNL